MCIEGYLKFVFSGLILVGSSLCLGNSLSLYTGQSVTEYIITEMFYTEYIATEYIVRCCHSGSNRNGLTLRYSHGGICISGEVYRNQFSIDLKSLIVGEMVLYLLAIQSRIKFHEGIPEGKVTTVAPTHRCTYPPITEGIR